jgi:hypothetical protein
MRNRLRQLLHQTEASPLEGSLAQRGGVCWAAISRCGAVGSLRRDDFPAINYHSTLNSHLLILNSEFLILNFQVVPLNLRPRFETVTAVEPNDVLRRLDVALGRDDAPVAGRVYSTSAVLKPRPEAVVFWSPQLQVSVDPHLPGGSVVRGQFGPRPAIWSLFVALYAAIGFLATMGMIFGYSQMTLGGSGKALWSGPVGLLLAVIVHIVARTGRRLGMAQMRELKGFLDDALGS